MVAAPTAATAALSEAAAVAAGGIALDEAATRERIDAQLRARSWEADTKALRHSLGTRPAKGRNMAIAEWPTAKGPADYALLVGLTCVSMIEAKRKNKNVSAAIDQAGRYAQGLQAEVGLELPAGGPWPADGAGQETPLRVPLVFSANGCGYLKQIEPQSGIWFRDTRDPAPYVPSLISRVRSPYAPGWAGLQRLLG